MLEAKHNIGRESASARWTSGRDRSMPTWASPNQCEAKGDWQLVDRALRTIAQRRAALDAEEARRSHVTRFRPRAPVVANPSSRSPVILGVRMRAPCGLVAERSCA